MNTYYPPVWAANQAGMGDQVTEAFAMMAILYLVILTLGFTVLGIVKVWQLMEERRSCKYGKPHAWWYAKSGVDEWQSFPFPGCDKRRCFRCGISELMRKK